MKKIFIYPAFAAILAIISLTSCDTNNKMTGEEKVDQTNDDVNESQKELNAEYPAFKTNADEKIAANEKRIVELRVKLNEPGKAPFDETRKKRIDKLEQQNTDLRNSLDTYEKENSDWEAFKREFNHDMEGIGKAFEDLGDNNKY